MASLLGNLVFAGQQTLLTTQASVGSINAAANLYSINTGNAASSLDVSLFAPSFLGQGTGAIGAGVGFGAATLQALLFTRSGTTVVYYNPNTTAMPGELLAMYVHSRVR